MTASAGRLVSVIIPVYNAAPYVEEAARSALAQPETAELVLVEDGSADASLEVCRSLERERAPMVKVLRHPGGANRGAGASRNLGVMEAKAGYIAFLDADDWMLAGRFAVSLPILEADETVDGVYEATEMHFADEAAERDWDAAAPGPRLVAVKPPDEPELLAKGLLLGSCGFFTTDGIVLRRRAFEKAGYFNESLRLGQDTELWWRMALTCKLLPGNVDVPVAVYRRYAGCRSTASDPKFWNASKELALSVYRWAKNRGLAAEQIRLTRSALTREVLKCLNCPQSGGRLRLQQLRNILRYARKCPGILVDSYLWGRVWKVLGGGA